MSFIILYKLCALPIRMCLTGEAHLHSQWGCALAVRHTFIPGEGVHYRQGTSSLPVRMYITGEEHPHSRPGCTLPTRHILTLSKDVHFRWTISLFLVRPHRECISWPGIGVAPLGMAMWLTRNAKSNMPDDSVSENPRFLRFWRKRVPFENFSTV